MLFSLMSIRMRVNAARFYKRCALKIYRAPENRSEARFLGKRSGRRSGQGGKRSAACHGALARRGAEGRNRRQYAAQFCAAAHGRFPPASRKFLSPARKKFREPICASRMRRAGGGKRSYPRCLPAAASSNISTILSMHFSIWKRSAYSIYCSRSAARSSGCSII